MDSQAKIEKAKPQWVERVREGINVNEGVLHCPDPKAQPVVIEWAKTDILSPKLAAFKLSVCEMAGEIIAPVETRFLRDYPQAASEEVFLKACLPHFENHNKPIDWLAVENTIKTTVKQFYLADLSKFPAEMIQPLLDDVYVLLKAKDGNTGSLTGFLMCAVTPALPYGNVKVINICAKPSENRGEIEALLLNSLFELIPEIERLFMFVRPTNDGDLKMFKSFGFTIDSNPFQDPSHKINADYLAVLEYKNNSSGTPFCKKGICKLC